MLNRARAVFWIFVAAGAACGRYGYEHHASPPGEVDAGGGGSSEAAPRILLLGIQGASASHVVRLRYDPAAPEESRVEQFGAPIYVGTMSGNSLRGLTAEGSGARVYAGGGNVAVEVDIAGGLAGDGMAVSGDLDGIHGLCTLPNGHLILGEASGDAGNTIAEFEVAGGMLRQVRRVYSTALVSGSLSKCAAVSNTELYLAEWAAWTDNDGDVVRLSRESGSWEATSRFDTSEFATSVYGESHQTSVYTFVHSDRGVYILPQRRFAGRIESLIRCPLASLDESSCEELGALPPDRSSEVNSPDAIQGAALGSDASELLFATNRALYRYDLDTDGWEELFDLEAEITDLATSAGATDRIEQVRNLVVLPPD